MVNCGVPKVFIEPVPEMVPKWFNESFIFKLEPVLRFKIPPPLITSVFVVNDNETGIDIVFGLCIVTTPLVSAGMLVAAIQVPPEFKDISQVEFEFQLPVATLLKYSLDEKAEVLNKKIEIIMRIL